MEEISTLGMVMEMTLIVFLALGDGQVVEKEKAELTLE